ncbi:MAG TPA: Tim44/TimA family putative adaptor protein [Rhodopila sp.]|uniref:Tim44/TimA family putative adaptor protein n=1 Tax=Rhodopila sp. TaxID=2480087 RepID=UPI002B7B8EBD|nr:Tim44/TimA family putative adaptor protein [Rhodopila sp.]HVY17229.1 Tim44/TimA family putative adaptor protein [Rhodopila sp.]
MGSSGSFPIDLVIFGMIAAFLVLRLRSILGKRTGFERPAAPAQPAQARRPAGPVIEGKAEPPAPPAATHMPESGSPAEQALAAMRSVDPNFDPARFLGGVDQAFRIIVHAFAAGDRTALRPLLGDETYAAFDQAIASREKAGETQVSDIKSVESINIVDAALRGRVGSMTVRIVSDQISHTTDKDGRPVSGTDALTEIIDLWTFERDLSQQDPTWRLVAVRSG